MTRGEIFGTKAEQPSVHDNDTGTTPHPTSPPFRQTQSTRLTRNEAILRVSRAESPWQDPEEISTTHERILRSAQELLSPEEALIPPADHPLAP